MNEIKFRSAPVSSVTIYYHHQTTMQILETISSDRRLSNVSFDFRSGGAEAAALQGRTVQSNVLLVEFQHDVGQMLSLIRDIAANCGEQTRAIVLGSVNDAVLYRDLISQGVSDYLVKPVSAETLIGAIGNLLMASVEKHGRSIAFIGAKGGVGTSTIVQNVGWFLANNNGSPTAILDANFGYGSIALLFNSNPVVTLADLSEQDGDVDDLVVQKLRVPVTDRLSLLSAPFHFQNWSHIREDYLTSVMAIAQGQNDFVLVDLPAHWDAITCQILRAVDDVVIVGCPNLLGLRNSKALTEAVRDIRNETKSPLLFLNASIEKIRTGIEKREFEKISGLTVAAYATYDPVNFEQSMMNGQAVLAFNSDTAFRKSVIDICEKLGLIEPKNEKNITKFVKKLPLFLRRKKGDRV